MPDSAVGDGAPSVAQLQERFKYVQRAGRRAALVPEDSGLAGQILAGALALVMIPPGGPIAGEDADAIFSRADYALRAGDIESAVHEVEKLSGLPAQVARYMMKQY